MRFINFVKRQWAKTSSDRLLNYYRNKGVSIGRGCICRDPRTTHIDITRPWLITIGDMVDMNINFTILTHDWCTHVFLGKYGKFLNSSGKVSIGNNVYFGANVTILKGVTIGDNCIIGAGSIVNKNIPSDSVAVGVPCNVIFKLDDYFKKREREAFLEARENIKAYVDRYGRRPKPEEFGEEFIYYVNENNVEHYVSLGVPVIRQMSHAYRNWIKGRTAMFNSWEELLDNALNQ
jgi:hypothetical protein